MLVPSHDEEVRVLRSGDTVTVCSECGVRADGPSLWCGSCGGSLRRGGATPGPGDEAARGDAERPGGTRRPAAVAIDDEGVTDVGTDRRRRHRWADPVLAAALVVGLLAGVVAVRRPPASEPAAAVETLVGRLDDETGRSTTGEPPTSPRHLWTAAVAEGPDADAWRGSDVFVLPAGPDRVLVGDRVLSLVDGSVLASSRSLLSVPVTPDGIAESRAGWLTDGRLVTVDPVLGTTIGDVEVRGEVEPYGWVVDFVGPLAIVVMWSDRAGGRALAVDTTTGDVAWRVDAELWNTAGDGWLLGFRSDATGPQGAFVLESATGRTVDVPLEVGSRWASSAVVAGGRAVWSTEDAVVASDLETGAVVWRRAMPPGRIAAVGDAVQHVAYDWGAQTVTVQWVGAADGRSLGSVESALATDFQDPESLIAVLDDALVVRSDTGVRLIEPRGPGWEVAVDDVHSLHAVGDDGANVLVVTGRFVPAEGRFVGDVEVVVLRRDGTRAFTAQVGPHVVDDGREVLAAVDGTVVVTRAGGRRLSDVAGVRLDDGTVLDDGAVGDGLLGSTTGRVDRGDVEFVGVLADGPGRGGPSPVLFWRTRTAAVTPLGILDLGRLPGEVIGEVAVVAGGRLAVPVELGTALVTLPSAGEGVPLDALVDRAVGAPDTGPSTGEVAVPDVDTVPDVQPVASVGGLLLAAEAAEAGEARSGDVAGAPLVAVDPTRGSVVWHSELRLAADRGSPWPGPAPRGGGWSVAGVVRGPDHSAVLATPQQVVSLDLRDGSVRWRTTELRGVTSVVAVDDLAVVATATSVVALDAATGRARWRHDPGDLVTALDAAGSSVLVGTGTGGVVVLGGDGTVLEEVGTADRVEDLAVVDGVLVVLQRGGLVSGYGVPADDVGTGRAVVVPGEAAPGDGPAVGAVDPS